MAARITPLEGFGGSYNNKCTYIVEQLLKNIDSTKVFSLKDKIITIIECHAICTESSRLSIPNKRNLNSDGYENYL